MMKVYIKVDDTGKIEQADTNALDGFLEVEIEDITDIFNYKYVDGALVELSEQEKEEFYPVDEKFEQENILQEMMLKAQRTSFLEELPDNEAVKVTLCYEEWSSFIGKSLSKGKRVQYEGKLYRVEQDVPTVLENQPPSINTAALYTVINVEHAGTIEDPIPASRGMEYEKGKYYSEDGKIYLMIRETTILYYLPSQLVGNHFQLVQ